MDLCVAPPDSSGFVGSITHYVDCQAQTLGVNAYSALSLPGSTLQLVLTGFLTIFIALIGYNLLLGRSLTVRSATLAAVKIGAVFTLATSWGAYQTLVYNLVADGPGQIVSDIGRPAGVIGADGTLVQRLDGADGALNELAILGTGVPNTVQQQEIAPPPFAGFNAFALGGSRILFLVVAIAGLAGVRLVAGLMLALGPFFIAFLMFDNTRSLFEGWVRVLAGAALVSIGISIALGLELGLLEPWLQTILAQRMAGQALPSIPAELFVVSAVFAIVVVMVVRASARLAWSFRLAPWTHTGNETAAAPAVRQAGQVPALVAGPALQQDERSRAAAVADVLVSLQRRESGVRALAGASRVPEIGNSNIRSGGGQDVRAAVPVGRAFPRRTRSRTSASAGKRDNRA